MNLVKVMLLSLIGIGLLACDDQPTQVLSATVQSTFEVKAELVADNSEQYSAPQIAGMWRFKVLYLAPEGSLLEAGQPLIRFDALDLEQRLTEKNNELARLKSDSARDQLVKLQQVKNVKLELAQAKMELDKAKRKVQQADDLVATNQAKKDALQHQLAQRQWQMAKGKLDFELKKSALNNQVLQNKINRVKAEITRINEQIASLTVIAKTAGTVVYLSDRHGKKVAIGDDVYVGKVLVEIPDMQNLSAKFAVDEFISTRLQKNQDVTLTFDVKPELEIQAELTDIGQIIRNIRPDLPQKVVDVSAMLKQTDFAWLKPGMTASVSIQLAPSAPILAKVQENADE